MYKIILIDFAFSDKNISKLRPALVLTKPDQYGDFIAAAITSNIHRMPQIGDILISENENKFHDTGLKISSLIRLSKLTTVNVKRVKGELGALPQKYNRQIQKGLSELFTL